jgi:protein ImuB
VRIAVSPTRFGAFAAAGEAGRSLRGPAAAGEETTVPAGDLRDFLAALPVAALAGRLDAPAPREGELIGALKRLGLDTLGGLAALSPSQLADRFGALGVRALSLARGEDTPLRPRPPREELVEEIELPDGVAGAQLDRAVELLVDRLLAAPGRRERTLLALRLSARLAGTGSWSVEQGLGRPSASPGVLRSLLVPKLEGLPEPARSLRLRALALGPPASDQLELAVAGGEARRNRLAAAAREVRAAAGAEALLRVVEVDPGSRLPERRALLAPYLDR